MGSFLKPRQPGRSKPKPKVKRALMAVHLSHEQVPLWEAIKDYADTHNLTYGSVVSQALSDFLDSNTQEEAI